jgi:hypothetical protein
MSSIRSFRVLIAIGFIALGAAGAFAASDSASHDIVLDVQEIAVIGLNDASSITLSTANTIEAGADPSTANDDTDASKLLRYTSVVQGGTTRVITVALGATGVPAGTQLAVEATNMPGAANVGSPTGEVVLSSTAANLITGIGSTATGTGANGVELTYRYRITDVSALTTDGDATVTVVYTLTDAS